MISKGRILKFTLRHGLAGSATVEFQLLLAVSLDLRARFITCILRFYRLLMYVLEQSKLEASVDYFPCPSATSNSLVIIKRSNSF